MSDSIEIADYCVCGKRCSINRKFLLHKKL